MAGLFGATTFAEDSSERLEPWSNDDLEILSGAIGAMFEQVQEIVRDGDQPGWTVPVTLSLAKELDWLGQFVGVRRRPLYTEAQFRTAIDEVSGFARGTRSSLIAAAARTLTGTKTVNFYERNGGDAYALTVITYKSQTPDETATEAAIRAVKPAGIVLTYLCVDGNTYTQVLADHTDYADLEASFADYQELRDYIAP